MVSIERHDDVVVLDLGDGENRFHPDWIAAVGKALDEANQQEGAKALVTTATGKFFSNGLDLDWLGENFDRFDSYIADVQELFARFLELPMITVAAIQGHAFAAGAMLTLAHDFRIMRADRGFWCLPEVDINIPFTPGMAALIQARLSKHTAHEAMLSSKRYGGTDAQAAQIVDRAVAEDAVRSSAVDLARSLSEKAGDTLGTSKKRMYAQALATLRQNSPTTD